MCFSIYFYDGIATDRELSKLNDVIAAANTDVKCGGERRSDRRYAKSTTVSLSFVAEAVASTRRWIKTRSGLRTQISLNSVTDL